MLRRLHPRRRGDAGQTSLEFMGLLVIAGLIFAAVGALALHTTISGNIETAICKIAHQDCHGTEAVSHEPQSECETLSESGEAEAGVTVFSVNVGGNAKYTLSRAVDKDGKVHWYVELEGGAQVGLDVLLGEEAKVGDFGEGVSGEIKALATGTAGSKYEFENEKAARDFITDAEYEAGKQVALSQLPFDPFGLGHKALDKVFGHDFKPPPPKETFVEGGGRIDGSIDAEVGAGTVGGTGSVAAVIGVKTEPHPEDGVGPERTVYLKLSSDEAAKFGLFETVGGQLGDSREVVMGLTYDGNGKPVKASLEAAGTLKGELGPEFKGEDTSLGKIAGFAPKGAPEGGASIGGAFEGKATFEVDLTKGNNLNVFADGLHSIGVPVLNGSGSASPPNPYQGLKGVYDLFDTGADGTSFTVNTYTGSDSGGDAGIKGGEGLAFGVEGGLTFEDRKLLSGSYYVPGKGFVPWTQCSK